MVWLDVKRHEAWRLSLPQGDKGPSPYFIGAVTLKPAKHQTRMLFLLPAKRPISHVHNGHGLSLERVGVRSVGHVSLNHITSSPRTWHSLHSWASSHHGWPCRTIQLASFGMKPRNSKGLFKPSGSSDCFLKDEDTDGLYSANCAIREYTHTQLIRLRSCGR